jgi:hypothetical protein
MKIMKKSILFLKAINQLLFGPYTLVFTLLTRKAIGQHVGNAIFLASVGLGYINIPLEVINRARGWHGKIAQKSGNIRALRDGLKAREGTVPTPSDTMVLLTSTVTRLDELAAKSVAGNITPNERHERGALLVTTIAFILGSVKPWIYGEYSLGHLSLNDVHELGFLLPGEAGGRHGRSNPTDVIAEVKPRVLSANMSRIILDQASAANAGPVAHGWADGARMAIILIHALEGAKEVVRLITTHLHNDIVMPEDCHGKQYVVKAAFLKHVDDEPRWSNEVTFTMPKTVLDLSAVLDQQHLDDMEEHLREVERHRQEMEELQAELAAAKAKLGES